MIWNVKDYLPDFKGALKGFYEESLQATLETKTQEFKRLLERNIAYGQKTQRGFSSHCPRNIFTVIDGLFLKVDLLILTHPF